MLSSGLLTTADVERMARSAYARHRDRTAGEPAWEDLDERSREANRDSVAFAPVILEALGLRMTRGPAGAHVRLTDEEVEAAARLEHLRWARFTAGRRPEHPDLTSWEALDEGTRDKDRVRVLDAVALLAEVGVTVHRDP